MTEDILDHLKLHNHSKRKRLHKLSSKVAKWGSEAHGPKGTKHPWGNREYRRSKQGKQEILVRLQNETKALREMLSANKKEESSATD